ncbi:MAG: hypothetical protein WC947_04745 [Elusimicrobiota bacterium]
MKKYYFSILILIMFYQVANSLENTSYRIQTLGSDFQGIIDDEYTDILANPARLSTLDKNHVYVKSTTPLSIGYLTNSFGCVAEGKGIFTKNLYYDWLQETWNWQIDALLMKSFGIKKIPFGVGIQNSYTGNISKYTPSQSESFNRESISKDFSANLRAGFYLQKENKIKEFIFSSDISIPNAKITKEIYQDYYYSSDRKIFEKTMNRVGSIGNGIEYHNRNKKNNNQTGFIVGYTYKPIKLKTDKYLILGTNVIYSSTTVSEGFDSSLYTGVGKSISFLDKKLFFAFAGRLNADYKFVETENANIGNEKIERTQNGVIGISAPLGSEYLISNIITLRFGITYNINFTKDRITSFESAYVHDNGSFTQSTNYRFGFGLKPLDDLTADFTTSGDILDVSSWKAQAKYSF